MLAGGVLALVAGVLLIAYFPKSLFTVTGVGALQLLLVLTAFASLIAWFRRTASLHEGEQPPSKASTRPDTRSPAVYSYHFSQHGVRVVAPHATRGHPWSRYCDVVRLPNFVVIEPLDAESIVIPNSGFASDQERENFVSVVRAYMEAGGNAGPMLIRDFLEDHVFACPKCKYNLQGCDGRSCPECGRPLTLADLPQARVRRTSNGGQIVGREKHDPIRPNQSPPEQAPFAEFAFELTEENLRRAYSAFVLQSGEWTRHLAQLSKRINASRNLIFASAITFFGSLILAVVGILPERQAPLLLIFCLAGAGSAALQWQKLRADHKDAISGDKWVRESLQAGAMGVWHIYFSDYGVRSLLNNTDTTYRWEHFYAVGRLPSHVAVLSPAGTSIFIPIEYFASEDAAMAFVGRIQKILEAHASTAAHRIVAYLRDHSMPCPKCRYELRGNQTGACPECGLVLTLDNVPKAKDPSLIAKN